MAKKDKFGSNTNFGLDPEQLDFSQETWSYKGNVPNYAIQADGLSYDIEDADGNDKNAICLGLLGMIIIVYNAKGPVIREDDILPPFKEVIAVRNWHTVTEKDANFLSQTAIKKLVSAETSGDVFDLASYAPIEIKRALLKKLFVIARYRLKPEFKEEAEDRIVNDIVPAIFDNPALELALLTGLIVKPVEEKPLAKEAVSEEEELVDAESEESSDALVVEPSVEETAAEIPVVEAAAPSAFEELERMNSQAEPAAPKEETPASASSKELVGNERKRVSKAQNVVGEKQPAAAPVKERAQDKFYKTDWEAPSAQQLMREYPSQQPEPNQEAPAQTYVPFSDMEAEVKAAAVAQSAAAIPEIQQPSKQNFGVQPQIASSVNIPQPPAPNFSAQQPSPSFEIPQPPAQNFGTKPPMPNYERNETVQPQYGQQFQQFQQPQQKPYSPNQNMPYQQPYSPNQNMPYQQPYPPQYPPQGMNMPPQQTGYQQPYPQQVPQQNQNRAGYGQQQMPPYPQQNQNIPPQQAGFQQPYPQQGMNRPPYPQQMPQQGYPLNPNMQQPFQPPQQGYPSDPNLQGNPQIDPRTGRPRKVNG